MSAWVVFSFHVGLMKLKSDIPVCKPPFSTTFTYKRLFSLIFSALQLTDCLKNKLWVRVQTYSSLLSPRPLFPRNENPLPKEQLLTKIRTYTMKPIHGCKQSKRSLYKVWWTSSLTPANQGDKWHSSRLTFLNFKATWAKPNCFLNFTGTCKAKGMLQNLYLASFFPVNFCFENLVFKNPFSLDEWQCLLEGPTPSFIVLPGAT